MAFCYVLESSINDHARPPHTGPFPQLGLGSAPRMRTTVVGRLE